MLRSCSIKLQIEQEATEETESLSSLRLFGLEFLNLRCLRLLLFNMHMFKYPASARSARC